MFGTGHESEIMVAYVFPFAIYILIPAVTGIVGEHFLLLDVGG